MAKSIFVRRRLLGLTFGHQLEPSNYEWLILAYAIKSDDGDSYTDRPWHTYAIRVEEEVWSKPFK